MIQVFFGSFMFFLFFFIFWVTLEQSNYGFFFFWIMIRYISHFSFPLQVVCRQLGYSGGTARMGGYYKKGTHEPVWLSQVKCAGTEEYIGLCSFKGWDNTGCKHMDDAGVTCGPPLTTTTTKRPLFSNWYPSRPLTRSTVPPTPSQPLTQSTVPPTPSQPTLPSSALTTVPPLSLDLVTQDQ